MVAVVAVVVQVVHAAAVAVGVDRWWSDSDGHHSSYRLHNRSPSCGRDSLAVNVNINCRRNSGPSQKDGQP